MLRFLTSDALYLLKRFEDAKKCLEYAKKYSDTPDLHNWDRILEDYSSERSRVPEIPDVEYAPAKASSSIEANVEKLVLKEETSTQQADTESSPSKSKDSSKDSSKTALLPPKHIRYDYFQSLKSCNVSLFIKNAPKDEVAVEFGPNSVHLEFPNPDGTTFQYDLGPLKGSIDPSLSSFRVFRTKIEFELHKDPQGLWPVLINDEGSSALVTEPTAIPSSTSSTSSSAAGSKSKNWEKLAEEALGDDEDEKNSDPNAFFQELFANADPDAKRAMMKSFLESNGTALSTNWEDVKKGPVATVPPEGVVAKKW